MTKSLDTTEAALTQTTDAMAWAREFKRIFNDRAPDEGTMLGWFANAIETGKRGWEASAKHPVVTDAMADRLCEAIFPFAWHVHNEKCRSLNVHRLNCALSENRE